MPKTTVSTIGFTRTTAEGFFERLLKSGVKRVLGAEPASTDPLPSPEPPAPRADAAPEPAAPPEPLASDEPAAGALSMDAVQAVLDDMVRPALQADGGDITLVKIEDDSVHVRLVGACGSCPSAVMTLRVGVESVLREEFPAMKELVQVW